MLPTTSSSDSACRGSGYQSSTLVAFIRSLPHAFVCMKTYVLVPSRSFIPWREVFLARFEVLDPSIKILCFSRSIYMKHIFVLHRVIHTYDNV
jgi:hypothetical protein